MALRYRPAWLAQLLAVAILGLLAHAEPSFSPLLGWANQPATLNVDEGMGYRLNWQVVNDADNELQIVVSEAIAAGKHTSPLSRHVTLVLLGSQMTTASMRQHSDTEILLELESIIKQSNSSMMYPYVLFSEESMAEKVKFLKGFQEINLKTVVLHCPGEEKASGTGLEQTLHQIKHDAASEQEQVTLIWMCLQVADEVAGTTSGLRSEIHQVLAAQSHLEAAGVPYTVLYAVVPQPEAQNAQQTSRRKLNALGAAGPYSECDALCQAQVKWMEGILFLIFLALAAMSGLCCLYVLDTPTRFQTAKEMDRS